MTRTAGRPIPRGRIAPGEAAGFGATLAVGSVVVLGLLVSWTAAVLLAFTIFFYVVIYTIWLKRRTPQNIVIGGAAGALPPVIGWVAATGSIGVEPILLFLMIFFWTPPHFWALSLLRADDYARARVPMLPVVSGVPVTRRQILLYSGLLIPIGAAPWLMGYAGLLYGVTALAAGVAMAALACRLLLARKVAEAARTAGRMFAFSIFYLFILFAALLVDDRLASLIGRGA
jgi:protoheme IX farnesyltransferase